MNSQPEESNEWGVNKGDWAVLSNEVPVLYRVYSTRMCWVLRCFWYGGCVGCYAATGIWRMCWVLCCYWYMADVLGVMLLLVYGGWISDFVYRKREASSDESSTKGLSV